MQARVELQAVQAEPALPWEAEGGVSEGQGEQAGWGTGQRWQQQGGSER